MSLYRRVKRKSNAELALQWDALAHLRDRQIRSGEDLTFNRVIIPNLFDLMGRKRFRRILDVGCGTGVLSSMLLPRAGSVDGIDISGASLDIAKGSNSSDNINFFHNSVEEYADRMHSKYDLVVANMVLMDVMNLKKVLSSIERLLKPGGLFIFSMTNPVFWASYFGYDSEDWYDYSEEIFIEGPFIISSDYGKSKKKEINYSTHVHRPISMYVNGISENNLMNLRLLEPMPDADVEGLYPARWKFPRYIIGRCVAGPKVKWI